MNCYLGDKRRSYSLSQNICGALLNIMKTNYIAMAPLQYFFIKNGDDEDEQCDYKIRD